MNNEEKILQMLGDLQTDITDMKTDIKQLKTDSRQMQADIDLIKIGQTEHTQLLNAIIHRADIQRAEIDKLNIETAKISGSIQNLRSDMNLVEEISGKNLVDIARLKAIK